MKTIVPICLFAAASTLCPAAPPEMKLVAEVKGFASPESVATDGKLYFVSNVGKELKPSEKDGDGFISRMGLGGEDLDLRFISGLNAPKGMLVQGGLLLVCDIDVLLGFDLSTKQKKLEISFAKDGVTFLNDVCAAPDGRLFVSATDKNKIYLVDPKDSSAKPIVLDKEPKGPNGLEFVSTGDEGFLLVAEWGGGEKPEGSVHAYRLDETMLKGERDDSDEESPIKPGFKDGIGLYSVDGTTLGLLHSDWVDFKPVGKLFLTLMEDEKNRELALPGGPLGGPADFHFCSKTCVLALPCMIDGRVLLVQFKQGQAKPADGEGK